MASAPVAPTSGSFKKRRIEAARHDINAFIEYVLRSERTQRQVLQLPVHREWQWKADNQRFWICWGPPECGKTQALAIARALFKLGRDPKRRIVIISNTHDKAMEVMGTIKEYIEHSEELHEVFPRLRRQPGGVWTNDKIAVERPRFIKDPSVQCFGLYGNVTGSRVDDFILEDILDQETTSTEYMRNKVWTWIEKTLFSRLTSQANEGHFATMLVTSNVWHPDDALHRMAKLKGWTWDKYPIYTEDGSYRFAGQVGSQYVEMIGDSRVQELQDMLSPGEFARIFLCQARDDTDARFKEEWVNRCIDRGIELEKDPAPRLDFVPAGYRTYTGVDFAVSMGEKADLTAFFTFILRPDGHREVLWCESGRWFAQDILDRAIDHHQRFGSILCVENVAAQDWMRQFIANRGVPVVPFTTGRGKASLDFQAEGLAAEMANGTWIIPARPGRQLNTELGQWVKELLFYNPKDHCGDRLAASLFARHASTIVAPQVEIMRAGLMRR